MESLNMIIAIIIKNNNILDENINVFYQQNVGCKSDIQIYKYSVVFNEFFTDDIKSIEKLYLQAKRIKNMFKRFIRRREWNKSVKYDNDTDLYLNKLSTFKDKYKITLLENNTRYSYRLSDLINYWTESLKQRQGLFSKPTHIKNPYTNLTFSNNNIYNIYFKLLETGFTIPVIITSLFKSDMNIKNFLHDYYPLLKEYTIDNFVQSYSIYEQWEQVLNAAHDFRKDINYITFTNFVSLRKKKHIWIELKYIIIHYLKYKYSCNPLISKASKVKTKRLLIAYLEKNPNFGYTIGMEIMRYVPFIEREVNIQPPPPPPPPPPPIIEIVRAPPINPFATRRELPRTPNRISRGHSTLSSSLSLFRR